MTHLELFAGIGGFRQAMNLLMRDGVMDFDCIGFSEIEPRAVTTYKSNFEIGPHEIEIGDIVNFTNAQDNIINLPDFDLLTGGFPCQTFSMMGNQAGFNEDRGQMFFRIMDVLANKMPRYILLENVKHLRSHNQGETIRCIIENLNGLGYNVVYNVFNTADFHLPQTRNRLLIFGTLEELPNNFQQEFNAENIKRLFDLHFLELSPFHYESVIEILSKQVPSKYFLSEKIKPTLLADGSANFKSKSDINMSIARPLTATMHKMHRACQDNYYSQDFIDSNGENNPVLYMSKKELANLPIRKLTPEEAFRLQGFPAVFAENAREAKVSDGALYKQAGNAVSVNTIYAVLYFLITQNIITE